MLNSQRKTSIQGQYLWAASVAASRYPEGQETKISFR